MDSQMYIYGLTLTDNKECRNGDLIGHFVDPNYPERHYVRVIRKSGKVQTCGPIDAAAAARMMRVW